MAKKTRIAYFANLRNSGKSIQRPCSLLSAKDSPISPSGLFGNEINKLEKTINHSSDLWGKSGMVYWNKEDLVKLADYPLNN